MKRLLVVLACIAYLVSPVDLMPEAILGPFGLGDDLVAAVVGFRAAFCGKGVER